MRAPLLILLMCLTAASALATQRRPISSIDALIPKQIVSHPYPDPDDPKAPKNITLMERYFEQPVDHNNPDDDRVWYQRYIEADDFYIPGGPVFVLLGGPWKIDGELAVNGSIGLLGRDLGAVFVELEHRYYGKSQPVETVTTEELVYLSIDQAISDLANFARTQQEQVEMYSGQWVIYGSGYAASLAAWARAQHPDLFVGAYASCPRLWIRPYFDSYYETVGVAFEDASPFCGQNISTGFHEMALIVAQGDNETLAEEFYFCDGTIDVRDPVDIQNLYHFMTSTLGKKVEIARVGNLTDDICYWMQGDFGGTMGSAFNRLAFIITISENWGVCLESDYQLALEYAKNNTYWSEDYPEKQWMYQLCSELGQFQTTSSTIGSNFVPIDHYLLYCSTVFGPQFNLGHLEAAASRLNELYGGLSPKGTNVVYTVGAFDPWHGLGNHQGTPDSPVIMIQEASHGLDLSGPGQNDTIYIQEARAQVAQTILSWLN